MSDFIVDGTSDEGAQAMGKALVESGKLSVEQVAALMRGEPAGAAPAVTTPEAAKARIEALKRDASFSARYTSGDAQARAQMDELHVLAAQAEATTAAEKTQPSEYKMPPVAPPNEAVTKEVAEFDARARQWLSDAGFTRETGSSVAHEIAKVAQVQRDASDQQRDAYRKAQEARLEAIFKGETKAKMNAARALVAELEARSPGIVELLEETGAGNSADVIAQLAMQAERRARRGPR